MTIKENSVLLLPQMLRVPGFALLLICASSLSCRPEALAGRPPLPACSAPNLSTLGWAELRAGRGNFALLLPAGAAELPVECTDSACGRIQVGAWRMGYDRGDLAGPGDTLVAEPDAEQVSLCAEQVDGRKVFIQTYRVSATARDYPVDLRGQLVGRAATVASPGSGLYLSIRTRSPDQLREFLAAVRTLRIY